MRGMMTPISEYARVAELYLKQLKVRHAKRDPDVLESAILLRDATRAYNRVIGRLRAQAERDPDSFTTSSGSKMSSESPLSESQQSSSDNTHDADIPLFRPRRAPLFRVFIPSPEGDWLSDASVHQCEAELKYAGLLELMRMGDVVWDIAVGDNGNFGRMIWDGKYLVVSVSSQLFFCDACLTFPYRTSIIPILKWVIFRNTSQLLRSPRPISIECYEQVRHRVIHSFALT